ncbi:MAG: MarR family winged helix-turn-helix transcriptional regulator [Acidimicrobiia bacterium]
MPRPIRIDAESFAQQFPEADALSCQNVANMNRLVGHISQAAAEMFRPAGLSPSGANVLALLASEVKPMTPAEVASQLMLTTGTITSVLHTLERDGFIRRKHHPVDGRKTLVELTAKARRTAPKLMKLSHEWSTHLMATLTAREQAQLDKLLAKLLGVTGEE